MSLLLSRSPNSPGEKVASGTVYSYPKPAESPTLHAMRLLSSSSSSSSSNPSSKLSGATPASKFRSSESSKPNEKADMPPLRIFRKAPPPAPKMDKIRRAGPSHNPTTSRDPTTPKRPNGVDPRNEFPPWFSEIQKSSSPPPEEISFHDDNIPPPFTPPSSPGTDSDSDSPSKSPCFRRSSTPANGESPGVLEAIFEGLVIASPHTPPTIRPFPPHRLSPTNNSRKAGEGRNIVAAIPAATKPPTRTTTAVPPARAGLSSYVSIPQPLPGRRTGVNTTAVRVVPPSRRSTTIHVGSSRPARPSRGSTTGSRLPRPIHRSGSTTIFTRSMGPSTRNLDTPAPTITTTSPPIPIISSKPLGRVEETATEEATGTTTSPSEESDSHETTPMTTNDVESTMSAFLLQNPLSLLSLGGGGGGGENRTPKPSSSSSDSKALMTNHQQSSHGLSSTSTTTTTTTQKYDPFPPAPTLFELGINPGSDTKSDIWMNEYLIGQGKWVEEFKAAPMPDFYTDISEAFQRQQNYGEPFTYTG